MSFNKTTIVGRVGRDPEMRYTPSGKAVTNFSVATSRKWKDANGEKHEETTWFKITTWDKAAETHNQWVKKGDLIMVEGALSCDPATGGPKVFKRQDGSAGATFELDHCQVTYLPNKRDGDGVVPADVSAQAIAGQDSQVAPDDDFPF